MRIGEARVVGTRSEIRNAFPVVSLSDGLQVVVPSLVLMHKDEVESMYDLLTERKKRAASKMRIVAHCLGQDCGQLHLVDTPGRSATEYFQPRTGKQLSTYEMPSVYAHTFGIIGLALNGVPDLLEEARSDAEVGKIVSVPALAQT